MNPARKDSILLDKGMLLQELEIVLEGLLDVTERQQDKSIDGCIARRNVLLGRIGFELVADLFVGERKHPAVSLG